MRTEKQASNKEIKKQLNNFIDNVDIKNLKSILNDFVLDSFSSFKEEGARSDEYLKNAFFNYFELLEFLDHLQEYQNEKERLYLESVKTNEDDEKEL